ncbi:hypothetical protein A9Q81_08090 [Gammaproteobacteria bacterium 42_54_T18]|nr:hypothetical protein A9Q81_08090 [Gammaproteobacteria bacterium 42_54_T18]
MKVLMLVIDQQRIQLESLYEGIAKHCSLDLRRLSTKEQSNLSRYFKKNIDTQKYGRTILFIRFKWALRQTDFIKKIPNLVILEHDACQNFIPQSKYYRKFSRYFNTVSGAKILVSGATIAEKFRKKDNADATFIPKGYDQNLLKNTHQSRTIELGFIGSIDRDTYIERKKILDRAKEELGLFVTRTNSGHDYLEKLNNIRFFLSADIGLGENMIKNFEAMACGCILIAFNQGDFENQALGFKDMNNIVLYDNFDTLERKLRKLQANNELCITISRNGQNLAEENFSFNRIGEKIIDEIAKPLREKKRSIIFNFLRKNKNSQRP